jgi:hypothetical protein
MTVVNRTAAPIVVTYEVVVPGGSEVTRLDPGERTLLAPALFGSDRCLPGELVARSGEEVVARLPQPCKEQVWEVMTPGATLATDP